ncbi:Spy/CpxP family protein refolding chaperone [Pseudoalteromonas neustonica]|uniref:Spy/CpxP family protein refolding chaperone n=1 Tax=Pseudoalteromonas neustonica TaxID=1840331 RepID=A0ABU9U6W7_9GAMM
MTMSAKISKLVLICGLATASLGTTAVMAKEGGHHKQGHSQQKHQARFLLSERGADKLSLTQAQQTQLQTIFDAQKAQFKALRGDDKEAMKKARMAHKEKMKTLLEMPTFDEAAANELLTERQTKGEQFALINLRTQHQVWQVLNAEQREKYSAMKKRMGKKGKGGKKGDRGEKKEG